MDLPGEAVRFHATGAGSQAGTGGGIRKAEQTSLDHRQPDDGVAKGRE